MALFKGPQEKLAQQTERTLKIAIIVVAICFIIAAWKIDNNWILAGLLAYIALP